MKIQKYKVYCVIKKTFSPAIPIGIFYVGEYDVVDDGAHSNRMLQRYTYSQMVSDVSFELYSSLGINYDATTIFSPV